MTDRKLGTPILRMGNVTSTMDVARRLEAFESSEGIAIIASCQTHGRGRCDRNWQSPRGSGLYCSILLRPDMSILQFQPFSVAVGLAICEALDPEHRLGLQLKWPNDIIFRGRKLAGILIATNLNGSQVASAIIGIGINLLADPSYPETSIALEEIPDVAGSVI